MSVVRALVLSVLLAATTVTVGASTTGPDVAAPATTTSVHSGDGLCC